MYYSVTTKKIRERKEEAEGERKKRDIQEQINATLLKVLFVRAVHARHVLAVLLLRSTLSLELLLVRSAQRLLLRLLHLNGVAKRIDHLFNLLDLHLLLHGLLHPFSVALAVELTRFRVGRGRHDPGLGAHRRRELRVVADQYNPTLEAIDGFCKSAERLAVEVVGRFVQNDNMGMVPHRGRKHHLDLLPARELTDTAVGAVLFVETNVLEMLLHVRRRQWSLERSAARRDLLVDLLQLLAPAHAFQFVERKPDGERTRLVFKLHLVLVVALGATLHAAVAGQRANHDLLLVLLETVVRLPAILKRLLHHGKLRIGRHHGVLHKRLLVVAMLIAPLDVLVGRLLKMVLDMVERMLRDVSDAAVRMLPYVAQLRLDLSGQQLDDRGLARAVRANARHARRETHANRHVAYLRTVDARIGVLDVVHLHDRLALRRDAFEIARLRKLKLERAGLELEVRLGLWLALHKLRQVALVRLQLQRIDLDDVGAHAFQEPLVVRHDDRRHVIQAVQIVFNPLHVDNVKMIGRLVEQQDVGTLKHSAAKRKLHAPTTGQMAHRALEHDFGESDRRQSLLDVFTRNVAAPNPLVRENVINNAQMAQLAENVSLDKHCPQLVRRRKAVDLPVCDGSHESGFPALVRANEAVPEPALQ
mmetsp:Transcript_2765/g.7577  ORF Transcript_2765/g.7577 Transcript_2765/m.7577 type:complete len:646 (-) Transcript_2765:295-2232(-)